MIKKTKIISQENTDFFFIQGRIPLLGLHNQRLEIKWIIANGIRKINPSNSTMKEKERKRSKYEKKMMKINEVKMERNAEEKALNERDDKK